MPTAIKVSLHVLNIEIIRMISLASIKTFLFAVFVFLPVVVFAQENDFYKSIIKESVNLDFIFDMEELDIQPDSSSTRGYIKLNVNKNPLPHMGYNYRQNSLLLNYKDSIPLDKQWTISPNLLTGYTDKEKEFDPNSTETVGDIIANGVLTPVAAVVVTPNPLIIFDFLMRIGVLSDEPFVRKETKKERALRIITKEIYPTGE